MTRRFLKTAAGYAAFAISGGLWIGAAGLADTTFRTAAVAVLAACFSASALWLLLVRLRGVFDERLATPRELIAAAATLAVAILAFAWVYKQLGLVAAFDPRHPVVHDFGEAAYFSVVTFTTVGYGDYRPVGVGRAVAGIQALTGYLVLAIIASTAAEVIKDEGRRRGAGKGDPEIAH